MKTTYMFWYFIICTDAVSTDITAFMDRYTQVKPCVR